MTLLETIRYNRNDRANDRRLWIISITVITGFFLIVLTLKFMSMLIVLGIILLELKIMRELNQWESVKAGWKYKLLEVNDESEILITTNTLEKLKQQVEGNTPIKAEGVYAADMKNGQN